MKKFVLYEGQQRDIADIMQSISPFSYLDKKVLTALTDRLEVREYNEGTYIFRQGDPSQQSLFVIVSGEAQVRAIDDQNNETVLAVRKEGDFFGETAFLSDEPYIASVITVKPVTVIVLPFDIVENILGRYPEFSNHFSRIMAGRMRAVYNLQMAGAASGYSTDQPIHKRVADLMTSPVVTCLPDDEVTALAGKMTTENVSSVVVVDKRNRPLGIITEKDLVKKIVAQGCYIHSVVASDVMSNNPLTISPESFYYEALLLMVGHNIKHLVVAAEEQLVGMVTIRDLMASRGTSALKIAKAIEQQSTIEGLAAISNETENILQLLVSENATAQETLQLITELFDRLTRKVIQVCEQEMVREGLGPPPVEYSWISMGSSGRQEQFVKTDQDNGIIYENVVLEREEDVSRYFLRLGQKVVDGLHRSGFALCPGNVMASNPVWCRSMRSWAKAISRWFDVMEPENVRLMTIFLDFRHIYGEKSLCDRMRRFVHKRVQDAPNVLHFLAQDDLNHRVPLNFFKQIITEKAGDKKDQVNLKAAAAVHMVDAVRCFSLRENINETNTFRRMGKLQERNVFSENDTDSFVNAYETLMSFRIRQSLLQLSRGEVPDNYLDPSQLSKREKASLREAFITVDRIQNMTSHAFKAYN